jgi:hypothetical protein
MVRLLSLHFVAGECSALLRQHQTWQRSRSLMGMWQGCLGMSRQQRL